MLCIEILPLKLTNVAIRAAGLEDAVGKASGASGWLFADIVVVTAWMLIGIKTISRYLIEEASG